MKLSKAQICLLREIHSRDKLYGGPYNYYFVGIKMRINYQTVWRLLREKLIKRIPGNGEPPHYVITPAGRAALAEAEGK